LAENKCFNLLFLKQFIKFGENPVMQDQFQTEVFLHASPARVWAALTESDQIEQYMFGSRLAGKWAPGEVIRYVVEKDGQETTMVHGTVRVVQPHELLEHTLFPTTWAGMEDLPENHLLIRYELEARERGALLRIIQSGFARAAEGAERLEHTRKGWEMTLPLLRKVVEQ
jgi:uncharacterized protein YndB with AHSA1/START domain